jgi:hypothetical protein
LPIKNIILQNNILYCVKYFGPIWSYDLNKEKVINHLDQSITNINSIVKSKHVTFLHSDNQGYFIIQNDSIYKLKIDIPINNSKFNFYSAGNTMLIQDGQNLICCEIDFIRKQIKAKEILNLQTLFPTIEITWINGNENGLWLGNSHYALLLYSRRSQRRFARQQLDYCLAKTATRRGLALLGWPKNASRRCRFGGRL